MSNEMESLGLEEASHEDQYRALNARLAKMREKLAALTALEEQKAIERKELETQLKAEGVNVDKLDEEILRLEKEIKEALDSGKKTIDEFEKQLNEVEA